MKNSLQLIPSIHALQNTSQYKELRIKYSIDDIKLTEYLQAAVEELRKEFLNQKRVGRTREELIHSIFSFLQSSLERNFSPSLKKVINATGTVLHTNLGRARLSNQSIHAVIECAKNYSNLEYNLEVGARGSRHDLVEGVLKRITGSEAAMVVNNNAAAVYLILRCLAKDKEVIVSRGELVEIGGSFRVSSIMEESGANLIEVGTTNRTHLRDYINAVTEDTKMWMKVHTSNFKIEGFTSSVSSEQLVNIKADYPEIIVYEDLGSGVLFDFSAYGIGNEPLVQDVVKAGVDLISFSGDKLLGGPQAGIIVGKKEWIEQLKKSQLARVLRVDKMTLAALETTLLMYEKGLDEAKKIPTIDAIIQSKDEVLQKIETFISELENATLRVALSIKEDVSQVGGGTMPGVLIPTYVLGIKHPTKTSASCVKELLASPTPIIARTKEDEIRLDFRTIVESEFEQIKKAILLL